MLLMMFGKRNVYFLTILLIIVASNSLLHYLEATSLLPPPLPLFLKLLEYSGDYQTTFFS